MNIASPRRRAAWQVERYPWVSLLRVLWASVLLLVSPGWVGAGVGGSISGTVFDPQGALVVGALVTVVNTATNAHLSIRSDANGAYSFRELAIGTYHLQVEAPGFKLYRRTNVVVNASSALLLNLDLVVGPQIDTVTVTQPVFSVETADTQ